MPVVDFSLFPYYPALTCSAAEHMAYAKLSVGDKDSLLPIFELSHIRDVQSLFKSAQMVKATAGNRPFILDVNKMPAPPPYLPKERKEDEGEEAKVQAEISIRSSGSREL